MPGHPLSTITGGSYAAYQDLAVILGLIGRDFNLTNLTVEIKDADEATALYREIHQLRLKAERIGVREDTDRLGYRAVTD